jgi:hypothetical protein
LTEVLAAASGGSSSPWLFLFAVPFIVFCLWRIHKTGRNAGGGWWHRMDVRDMPPKDEQGPR